MASFNSPQISSRIADDLPAVRKIQGDLARLRPDDGNTDYPNGTVRKMETANGYEFQQWNGSSWVTLEKWNIDTQKVDGYSAATGTTASTIPVRDTSGKLPGDITGNAATASTAAALSAVNPVNMGGTGATTAASARSNLGVPPTSHASMGTTYGIGTSANYGHVKLSDSTSATSDASTGIAASPKAVKAAYDRGTEGVSAAATVQTNLTNAVATQATCDAEQDAAIRAAQTAADAAQATADAAQATADAAQATADAAQASANSKQEKLGYTPVKSANGVGADADGNVSTMPDYRAGITVGNATTTQQEYTAPADGFMVLNLLASSDGRCYVLVNNVTLFDAYGSQTVDTANTVCIQVCKGDVVKYITASGGIPGQTVKFFPLKGA